MPLPRSRSFLPRSRKLSWAAVSFGVALMAAPLTAFADAGSQDPTRGRSEGKIRARSERPAPSRQAERNRQRHDSQRYERQRSRSQDGYQGRQGSRSRSGENWHSRQGRDHRQRGDSYRGERHRTDRYYDDKYRGQRYRGDKYRDDKYSGDRYRDDYRYGDRYRSHRYRGDKYRGDHYRGDRYGYGNDHYEYRDPYYHRYGRPAYGRPWYGARFHGGFYVDFGRYHGRRFDVPRRVVGYGHDYDSYFYGTVYHGPIGQSLEIYLFPVYYRDRVEYRPYAYCEGKLYGRARFDSYGGLSFDIRFDF